MIFVDEAPFFSMAPQWAEPIRLAWRYQTEVGTALSGAEERAALRPYPRLRLGWSILGGNPEAKTLVADTIQAALNRSRCAVPVWCRPCYVRSVDGAAVTLENGGIGFAPGQHVFFGDTGVVESWQDGVLRLTGPVAIPAGAPLFRVIFGRLTENSTKSATDWVETINLTVSED